MIALAVIISAADSAPFGSVSSNVKSDLVLVSRNNKTILCVTGQYLRELLDFEQFSD